MASLFSKLQYKGQDTILLRNAPDEFRPYLAEVEVSARVDEAPVDNATYNFALVFVTSAAQIQELVASTVASLDKDPILWFAYPKKSSKRYKTDISRDNGWQPLGDAGHEPVRQVAIDADWSALRFRPVGQIKTMKRSFAMSEEGKRRTRR